VVSHIVCMCMRVVKMVRCRRVKDVEAEWHFVGVSAVQAVCVNR